MRKFLSYGLNLVPGMAKFFAMFLLSCLPSQRFLRVMRSGWLENSWVYVQSNWVAGDAGETVHLELEQHCPTIGSMTASGTLQEWQDNIAAPLRGNHLAIFCLLFALLGPLRKPLGVEGGGIHLAGPSSVGKSTGGLGSASVYGCGISPSVNSGKSYMQLWNQTSNALEGIAAAHTDAVTVLDEIGLYAGGDLGSDLYLLAGGRGKGAMDSNRRMKEVSTWNGNILSTGEMTMQEAIERKGGRMHAGMSVRILDLPVTNMFPNPPNGMTSGEFSNLIKANCATYYGTAGQAFVTALVGALQDDSDQVISCLREQLDDFTREMTPADATPLQERAIRRFAAIRVAGHAAVEAEVIPYTTDEVDECIAAVIDSWIKFRPTVTDVQRALVHLQDFLVRQGQAFPAFSDDHASNPKGFRDVSKGIYAFTDAQLAAATGGGNLVEVAKELRRLKHLFCNENGRLKAKLKIVSGPESRFYAVAKTFLAADLQISDADDSVMLDSRNDD